MKKFLSVVLIILSAAVSGCGNKKNAEQPTLVKSANVVSKNSRVDKMIYASPERTCTCVVNVEDVDDMIFIAQKKSDVFYDIMVRTGKIFLVSENTKVACYYAEEYRGFVPVIFFEGKYKGRRAYVLTNRLQ